MEGFQYAPSVASFDVITLLTVMKRKHILFFRSMLAHPLSPEGDLFLWQIKVLEDLGHIGPGKSRKVAVRNSLDLYRITSAANC
ncbi:unnamed protein product [Nesidiocoris tenuis]|uniref:Uncharacterized protein n=1 Tax=Nesidiocoris tenuis TaxID=355587 RepID=A0A6H5GJ96_9HEMI|nr:unnamed protein product [Nesidiocoris tenuis]